MVLLLRLFRVCLLSHRYQLSYGFGIQKYLVMFGPQSPEAQRRRRLFAGVQGAFLDLDNKGSKLFNNLEQFRAGNH